MIRQSKPWRGRIKLYGTLNNAHWGLCLADDVMENPECSLDFGEVDRMTPSYANAFVMTIRDAGVKVPNMENANKNVLDAITKASERFDNGIRLSTQR